MVDDILKEPTRTEQVMFVTLREVIEGTLYHNENVRLSDALNAESRHHSRYITLKDATIYSISTGREILKTAFLLVSHSHVIYMTPKNCVQTSAGANLQSAQQAAFRHAALRSETQPTPTTVMDEETTSDAWAAIPAPVAESMTEPMAAPMSGASSPELLEAPRTAYRWGSDAGAAARHAVVTGTDVHLVSRQAMLDALGSIRGHTMEPPRHDARMVK